MRFIDTNNPNTQLFLQRIGQVIVEVNHVESLVGRLIWQLIGAKEPENEIGRRITVGLSFMQKADLLRSLVVERRGEEFTKNFTARLYKKLQSLAEKRDDLAHSLWFIEYGKNKDNLSTEKINFFKAYERGKQFNFDIAKNKVVIDDLDEMLILIDNITAEIIHFAVNEL